MSRRRVEKFKKFEEQGRKDESRTKDDQKDKQGEKKGRIHPETLPVLIRAARAKYETT